MYSFITVIASSVSSSSTHRHTGSSLLFIVLEIVCIFLHLMVMIFGCTTIPPVVVVHHMVCECNLKYSEKLIQNKSVFNRFNRTLLNNVKNVKKAVKKLAEKSLLSDKNFSHQTDSIFGKQ